ncbi:protein translocase subunit SecF [Nocardioides acrostichi]|uniref:Protein-export membrane protein SecF n=1 Tax=Nocardioides acrostichi TaxID=2784339 RepID=A0A930Y7P1_9ACTN|nr:protein translocase subunit SecF [Nocardioides acrostichi]MBF4162201.1 protein translocase subunit SecF [Nocardioides acrostichi]
MGAFARFGNDLYAGRRSIDFVGRWKLWYLISFVIVALAIGGVAFKGLNLGIEFTGGTAFRVQVADGASQSEVDAIREAVKSTGIEAASNPVASTVGTDGVLVQTEPLSPTEGEQVTSAILAETGTADGSISQSDVGASWGKQVAQKSFIGLTVFIILTALFIWAYFRELKMSMAALLALVHDVVITVGVYALTGFEVSPATVTGILTILAFSLYDTVVVFDKVKENVKQMREKHQTYAQAANLAVNQTLVRSINTSIVALLPVGTILVIGSIQLGASTLQDLALALFVGTAAGTYSSIFIATPFLVQLKSSESEVKAAERHAKARARVEADRYAAVPSFAEDMPLASEPAGLEGLQGDPVPEDTTVRGAGGSGPVTAPRASEAYGRGRVAPPSKGEVRDSASSGRQQPTRQSRSKRGRK